MCSVHTPEGAEGAWSGQSSQGGRRLAGAHLGARARRWMKTRAAHRYSVVVVFVVTDVFIDLVVVVIVVLVTIVVVVFVVVVFIFRSSSSCPHIVYS